MMKEIKLAAFDIGGVMLDVDEANPIARFAKLSGKNKQSVFDAIFSPEKKHPIETGAITPEEHAHRAMKLLGLKLSLEEFWRIHCTSHSPNIEVGQIVESVANQTQITIASNLPEPHGEWALKNLSFAKIFTPPILSFDIGVMKPDLTYYEAIVSKSGYAPEDIFFVDDRPENVEAASKLGIRAFMFKSPELLKTDLASCGLSGG